MTNEEREQVVELLRCAADVGGLGKAYERAYGVAMLQVNPKTRRERHPVWWLAMKARTDLNDGRWTRYADTCLEAAARVEEGSWP